jgi:uncharacterized protein YdiU (UPF0061 family)
MAASPYRPSTAHGSLGAAFADPVRAAKFPELTLRFRNQAAAATVGLAPLSDSAWLDHFGRFEPLPGSFPQPLALRYHGHQFQHYNPDLGDGRGFLFAQLYERDSNRLLDLGTKGTGTTPFSRGGDGRLTLQGGIREVLAAELLQARGVPTCRILSLVETGESLYRHDEDSPTRGAVMVRLSHSHIRIGTFQRLAYHRQHDDLARLVHHVVTHYYPQLAGEPDLPSALLRAVVDTTTATLGGWMAAGFVHGVLNTDNINITGESFDYGPWRFAVDLDPGFTAAYFDHGGLYAYGRQPDAIRWNLKQLALALEPIGDRTRLADAVSTFSSAYVRNSTHAWLRRLGIAPESELRDRALVHRIIRALAESRLPLDRFVYDWFGGGSATERALTGPLGALYRRRWFAPTRQALESRSPCATADQWVNAAPGPVSLPIEAVRSIWQSIAERNDWQPFLNKIQAIRSRTVA